MENTFKDQIAIVTGASRGFGHAVAVELASRGAHVVAVARTVGGLEELADKVDSLPGSCTLVPLDITDDEGLARMGRAIFDRWGKADLWVHTAVHTPPLTPAAHVQKKDLTKGTAINYVALQRAITMIEPLLRAAPNGRAVFIDEDVAGKPLQAGFGAMKAAQRAMMQSWQAESINTGPEVILHTPPPLPTAHRARFFPGEDRETLTPLPVAAKALVDRLS
ncbi:NADP-dependent 3-hydroxy acid dehydrogenase YdfG [Rubricella aquisinus]|uniref:NADP-dependent 3-hydroxy acid dehydrogenase YdfG n=1 Tax=Rubricella aquisinus TaxID=2028108 RepID=A0A840X3X3_9RHOB|nr:SDR family NAD(P)-dependent oxidoreductase [Rubricella aquisinus]MBB5516506.1 NADP-dependent 3-hydroxy acid dehydrogenase YdfG [Rubricella aquisinus]